MLYEVITQAHHRLHRAVGVQGGEDQVAGLCRLQGDPRDLGIAHLADEDHIGVLAQDSYNFV